MKNLLPYILIIFSSLTLVAQEGGQGIPSGGLGSDQGGFSGNNVNSGIGQDFLNKALGLAMGEDREMAYDKIKGNPFLTDEPVKGTLLMHNGKMVKDILLQIDLYTDEFIATKEDGEDILLDKTVLSELIIPTKDETIVLRKLDPEKPDSFYELLYKDAGLVFYKQRYVTLREGTNSGLAKVDPKFNQRSKYFIKHGNKPAKNVKLKKKEILEGFTKREQKTITNYAKSQKIKFKKEADYVAIFEGVSY